MESALTLLNNNILMCDIFCPHILSTAHSTTVRSTYANYLFHKITITIR